jgi:hypothetical protein
MEPGWGLPLKNVNPRLVVREYLRSQELLGEGREVNLLAINEGLAHKGVGLAARILETHSKGRVPEPRL